MNAEPTLASLQQQEIYVQFLGLVAAALIVIAVAVLVAVYQRGPRAAEEDPSYCARCTDTLANTEAVAAGRWPVQIPTGPVRVDHH